MDEKIKVLVVDDDRRMVKTICDILRIKGHEALPAYTGEEAIALIESDGPDCVLMDMKMSGMNGVETMKIIKEMSPDLPVILMSAYATEDQAVEAQKLGAYTVLDKPINIEMVLSFLSLIRMEESILVVDDDPRFCATLCEILQSRGYHVENEAVSGNVLNRMEKEYKLAVMINLKMGDTAGLDVLKKVRAQYPTKPVLLVTPYQEDASDLIKQAQQVGAYTYFYNPLETEKFFSTIKEIRHKKLGAVLGEPFEMPQQATKKNG
jgi:two-component system response regulator HydG